MTRIETGMLWIHIHQHTFITSYLLGLQMRTQLWYTTGNQVEIF